MKNDSEKKIILEMSETIKAKKKCAWCIHADLGDGACKDCKNKSLWNVKLDK